MTRSSKHAFATEQSARLSSIGLGVCACGDDIAGECKKCDPSLASPVKLTYETITDEQIRALRDSVLVSGIVPAGAHEIIRATNEALGGGRQSTRINGRRKCAEIINARGGK